MLFIFGDRLPRNSRSEKETIMIFDEGKEAAPKEGCLVVAYIALDL